MNDTLSQEQIASLENARASLSYIANRDCDCYWNDKTVVPTDDNRSCEVCQARLAMRDIDDVLMPRIEGLHPDRMKNPPELIYVEAFRKECERSPGVNHGYGLLELLLQPEGEKLVPAVGQRDARVATTIIQWLGTNCGRGFVLECERKIESALAERSRIEGIPGMAPYLVCRNAASDRREAARRISQSYISIDKHPKAAECLERSIVAAIEYFTAQAPAGGQKELIYDC